MYGDRKDFIYQCWFLLFSYQSIFCKYVVKCYNLLVIFSCCITHFKVIHHILIIENDKSCNLNKFKQMVDSETLEKCYMNKRMFSFLESSSDLLDLRGQIFFLFHEITNFRASTFLWQNFTMRNCPFAYRVDSKMWFLEVQVWNTLVYNY